jgi:glycosyltransferase involved in cell wall biosynthesis
MMKKLSGQKEIDAVADAALNHRLLAAARYLLPMSDATILDLANRGAGVLAAELSRCVAASGRFSDVWLLFVTLTSVFPDIDRVTGVARALRLATPDRLLVTLLEEAWDDAARWSFLDVEMEIVTDRVVVDVNFCAGNDHNTGIQRVVRETMSRWYGQRPIELVCWTEPGTSMRALSPIELRRVTDWDALPLSARKDASPVTPRLIVPFRTAVILPEVPFERFGGHLSALAACSGNRVGVVGHDTIPIVSAEDVSSAETNKFVTFLKVVKHVDRIAGVSESAAAEFRGYTEALHSQGLPGAEVVAVPLAVHAPAAWRNVIVEDHGEPLVLVVGSQEPRKNHLPILFAAEQLWREGLRFTLRFIGGGSSGWYVRRFDKLVRQLKKRGRSIEVLRGVGDDVLVASYRRAWFSVFPSLHEGFGLPAAESLSTGTPVVTSNYGSTAEIAAAGGCVTVNPRDDEDLMRGMRLLLEDKDELKRLTAEAKERPTRSWDDYSSELWQELVEPLRMDTP